MGNDGGMKTTTQSYSEAEAASAALYAAQLRGDVSAIPALRLAATLAWGAHAANCQAQYRFNESNAEARQLGFTALD